MSWSDCTKEALRRQGGICDICHGPVRGTAVGHHAKNRCQGGPSTVDNCRARCSCCERAAHAAHRYGNPTEPVEVHREYRARKCKGAKKNRKKLARKERRQLRRTGLTRYMREMLRLYGPDPDKEE